MRVLVEDVFLRVTDPWLARLIIGDTWQEAWEVQRWMTTILRSGRSCEQALTVGFRLTRDIRLDSNEGMLLTQNRNSHQMGQ